MTTVGLNRAMIVSALAVSFSFLPQQRTALAICWFGIAVALQFGPGKTLPEALPKSRTSFHFLSGVLVLGNLVTAAGNLSERRWMEAATDLCTAVHFLAVFTATRNVGAP